MSSQLEKQFERIGAAVELMVMQTTPQKKRDWNRKERLRRHVPAVRIDIQIDREGNERFFVNRRPGVQIEVKDISPDDRHLLLFSRDEGLRGKPSAYLCGHDERAWFVAAIPESANVGTVQDAKDALKPQEVWDAMKEFDVPMSERDNRWTAAFVRQGEWFFIRRPNFDASGMEVLIHEPIRRGGGKPHLCQCLVREEGHQVWVHADFPDGLTQEEYYSLPRDDRFSSGWTTMMRDARVHVKGYVQHSDHETVWLEGWHQVVMNTENKSKAMQNVAFLD